MTEEEHKFYRELRAVVNDPFIAGIIAKYAEIGYTKALNSLKKAKDVHAVGYYQGELEAWEKLKNIKEFANSVLNKQ